MSSNEVSNRLWCNKYVGSRVTSTLVSPFRENVEKFIKMLKANGAKVHIEATRRPKERAYLMHWSWKISKQKGFPKNKMPEVKIEWNHKKEKDSIGAAEEMTRCFGITTNQGAPSLTSRHIVGKAIDMKITKLPAKLKLNHNGKQIEVDVGSPAEGNDNEKLYDLAKKYFNVVKCVSSKPHWSVDGH